MPATSSTEVDPQFSLYPYQRQRNEQMDEICLKNQKVSKELKEKNMQPVASMTYTMGITKNKSGSYINNLDVPTGLVPGNFGCRVVDTMLPADLSVVHKDRKSTMQNNYVCDLERYNVPQPLSQPDKTDYLTDEESDDGPVFELKVPQLKDLLNEFEMNDDVLMAGEMELKQRAADLKARGLQAEPREQIILQKAKRTNMLESNIEKQREFMCSSLPSMLSELNTAVRSSENKLYLR
jgi:hypothetical protein